MALPATINTATPTDSDNANTTHTIFQALKLFVEDVFGMTDVTAIAAAGSAHTAAGMTTLVFQNLGGDPSATGELARNATLLKFHDGTAARTIYTVGGTDVAVTDGGTG